MCGSGKRCQTLPSDFSRDRERNRIRAKRFNTEAEQ